MQAEKAEKKADGIIEAMSKEDTQKLKAVIEARKRTAVIVKVRLSSNSVINRHKSS